MGQSIETLAKNIALYRKSWKEAGHLGHGRVTVLLPTFIGQDGAAMKTAVREPMTAYLKNDRALIREAVWDYPAFQRRSEEGVTLDGFLDGLSDAEMTDLVEFAFERSYATGGLFGNRAQCLPTVQSLQQIGVDEIACLVDFGLPADLILQHLPELNELKLAATGESADEETDDIATLIERHQVTHFQCTPPRAASLMWDQRTRQAMTRLQLMIVGGEAMSEELARQLRSTVSGRVFNVYGPTETTVWSTMQLLTEISGPVPIGKPIGNTQIYVTDERQQPLPIGIPGELLIGGDGVGRGYLKRPDLTADALSQNGARHVYRTGDLVRLRPDGVVEFLGRFDDQVKIRGHRIELGEIEAVLESHPAIRKAVVHPQDDTAGGKRLVAYIVPNSVDVCGETLRPFVSQRLPEFMVPSHFETMSELPLTPSGKVDRRALPKPNFGLRRETGCRQADPATIGDRAAVGRIVAGAAGSLRHRSSGQFLRTRRPFAARHAARSARSPKSSASAWRPRVCWSARSRRLPLKSTNRKLNRRRWSSKDGEPSLRRPSSNGSPVSCEVNDQSVRVKGTTRRARTEASITTRARFTHWWH